MKPRAAQIRLNPSGLLVVTGTDVQAAVAQLDASAAGHESRLDALDAVADRELLMQDGVSSPPVPVETEDGTDWLYGG